MPINQNEIIQRIKDLKALLPGAEGEELRTYIVQLRQLLPKTDKILRIDADSLIYMVAYAPSYKPEASIEGGTFKGDVTKFTLKDYKMHFKQLVAEVVQACELESYLGTMARFSDYELVFTASTNFRYDIFPDYKKSRYNITQSNALVRLKRYVKNYLGIVPEGIEADDYVYYWGLKGHPIASGDKDVIYSIPGGVYWYHSAHKEVITNTKESSDRFVLLQALAGDSVDDIPGIKGVALKTAEKLLPDGGTFEDVINIYLDKGLTKEDALLTRRLIGLDQWNGKRVRLFRGGRV